MEDYNYVHILPQKSIRGNADYVNIDNVHFSMANNSAHNLVKVYIKIVPLEKIINVNGKEYEVTDMEYFEIMEILEPDEEEDEED